MSSGGRTDQQIISVLWYKNIPYTTAVTYLLPGFYIFYGQLQYYGVIRFCICCINLINMGFSFHNDCFSRNESILLPIQRDQREQTWNKLKGCADTHMHAHAQTHTRTLLVEP